MHKSINMRSMEENKIIKNENNVIKKKVYDMAKKSL